MCVSTDPIIIDIPLNDGERAFMPHGFRKSLQHEIFVQEIILRGLDDLFQELVNSLCGWRWLALRRAEVLHLFPRLPRTEQRCPYDTPQPRLRLQVMSPLTQEPWIPWRK